MAMGTSDHQSVDEISISIDPCAVDTCECNTPEEQIALLTHLLGPHVDPGHLHTIMSSPALVSTGASLFTLAQGIAIHGLRLSAHAFLRRVVWGLSEARTLACATLDGRSVGVAAQAEGALQAAEEVVARVRAALRSRPEAAAPDTSALLEPQRKAVAARRRVFVRVGSGGGGGGAEAVKRLSAVRSQRVGMAEAAAGVDASVYEARERAACRAAVYVPHVGVHGVQQRGAAGRIALLAGVFRSAVLRGGRAAFAEEASSPAVAGGVASQAKRRRVAVDE